MGKMGGLAALLGTAIAGIGYAAYSAYQAGVNMAKSITNMGYQALQNMTSVYNNPVAQQQALVGYNETMKQIAQNSHMLGVSGGVMAAAIGGLVAIGLGAAVYKAHKASKSY